MDWLDIAFVVDVVAGVAVSVALLLLCKVFWPTPLASAPVRQGRVSLLTAFGVFALYIGLEIAALPVLIILGLSGAGGPRSLLENVVFQGVAAGVELLVCVFIVLMMRWVMVGGLRGWGLGMADLRRGVRYGVAAMVVVYPLLLMLNQGMEDLLERFGKRLVEHETFDLLKENPAFWQTVVLVVVPAAVAPVAEEMFFRGIVQTALIQKGWGFWWEIPRLTSRGFEVVGLDYGVADGGAAPGYRPGVGQRWAAILMTAALFAGAHMSPTNFPVLFVLGVGLGYVYERTGNLWASMTLHALFNLVNLAEFFLSGGM